METNSGTWINLRVPLVFCSFSSTASFYKYRILMYYICRGASGNGSSLTSEKERHELKPGRKTYLVEPLLLPLLLVTLAIVSVIIGGFFCVMLWQITSHLRYRRFLLQSVSLTSDCQRINE